MFPARQSNAMADSLPASPSDLATLSFEDGLRALEEIVRKLESGEAPLDESITLYERGEALRKHCQARLDAAQARIERIVQAPDGSVCRPRPLDDPDS
jgi:exodeoxyribonuclease VII small subunit